MIGIIGYGRFGKLTAKYLSVDFDVRVWSRNPFTIEEDCTRVKAASLDEICRQKIVVPTVPISAFRSTLKRIAPLLKKDAVVIDVCSVKTYPVQWMTQLLPESVSILATHPMFGPDSAANTVAGMKIAVCRVRLKERIYQKITSYLSSRGLVVIETTPERHDEEIQRTNHQVKSGIKHEVDLTHIIGGP